MAKSSNKLSAADKKDLESIGWVESSPFNIPENVSPVLKAKIVEAYSEQEGVENPAFDLPDATYRQNELARQRAAADGDKDMQEYTGVQGGESTGGRQTDAASGQNARTSDKK